MSKGGGGPEENGATPDNRVFPGRKKGREKGARQEKNPDGGKKDVCAGKEGSEGRGLYFMGRHHFFGREKKGGTLWGTTALQFYSVHQKVKPSQIVRRTVTFQAQRNPGGERARESKKKKKKFLVFETASTREEVSSSGKQNRSGERGKRSLRMSKKKKKVVTHENRPSPQRRKGTR